MLILDRAEAGHRFSWSWEVLFFFFLFYFACQYFFDEPPPLPTFQKRCCVITKILGDWNQELTLPIFNLIAGRGTVTKVKKCYEWLIIPNNPHNFLNVHSNNKLQNKAKKTIIIKLPGILPSKRHSSRIIMVQKCARVFVN